MSRITIRMRHLVSACMFLCYAGVALSAQEVAKQTQTTLPDAPAPSPEADDSAPSMFPHSDTSRFYIAGQANIIFQAHGPFHSPYEGINSFLGRGEYKVSLLGTLFLAAQVRRDPKTETDALFNLESAGG